MIYVKRLVEQAKLPEKAHESDAGYDLFAVGSYIIPAKNRTTVDTGISVELPNLGIMSRDLYLRIAPRSGMAHTYGIDVFAGVVDRGYTGEIKVILFNSSDEDYEVKEGDKIAQMIPTYIYKGDIVEKQELSVTDRNDDGIGSTGQ